MKQTQRLISLISLVLAGPAIANESITWERQTLGACEEVFGGEICTWSRERGNDLIEFGATVPLATVENAPLEGEMVFPPVTLARIPLPESVREQTGVNHLGINWETHGHPPGPFMTPHFDFHFYTVSSEQVDAIDCADTNKPAVLPETYVLPDMQMPDGTTLVGVCVPAMGMHALAEPELNATTLFEASMVVGYYARNLVFIEPMIARDKLLQRADFSLAVPITGEAKPGPAWPAGFNARFDEAGSAWQLVFTMGPAE